MSGFLPPLSGATPSQLATSIHNIAHRDKWTPVLTFETPGNLAVTYSTQVGQWVKVGLWVTLQFYIETSGFTHTTASGALQITGSPFKAEDLDDQYFVGPLYFQGITKAGMTQFVTHIAPASKVVEIYTSGSGVAASEVLAADMPTGGTVILVGQLSYWIRK